MEDKYVKYGRTPHLHWSTGTKDDKILRNDSHLIGKRVVASIKMDGECTGLYSDYVHARSIESSSHPSQSWVRKFQGEIGYLLDDDMRVYGENLYARHTIGYENLKSYFYGFSFWKGDWCYGWDVTVSLFELLGIVPVEVFYDGIYDKEKIHKLFEENHSHEEGYVVRCYDGFKKDEFANSIAKYVKPEFKQSVNDANKHWKQSKIIPNKLSEKEVEITIDKP